MDGSQRQAILETRRLQMWPVVSWHGSSRAVSYGKKLVPKMRHKTGLEWPRRLTPQAEAQPTNDMNEPTTPADNQTAPMAVASGAVLGESKCGCRQCLRERGLIRHFSLTGNDLTTMNTGGGFAGMIVCEICGNKRCPHATDHRYGCTNSNEPGQHGSVFA